MINLSRKRKIKEIEELLKEGEKRHEQKNRIIDKLIGGKIPMTPEMAAVLIESTILELNAVMRIAHLGRSLKHVSIEVIENWRITDLLENGHRVP